MEGGNGRDSSESECWKTWASSSCKNEDEEEEDEKKSDINGGGGGSSSNSSSVEENHEMNKASSVRPYVRSKMPRLRWTPDLHLRFVNAVDRFGGQDRATPKLVLQLMNVKGLNIAHVKSHLQMYRSKKIDDPSSQGIADHHRHLLEAADTNIYNLSQLPMLHGFNQNVLKYPSMNTDRYGDASWNGLQNLIHSPIMGLSTVKKMRPGSYETPSGRVFGNNFCGTRNLDDCSEILNSNQRQGEADELKCEMKSFFTHNQRKQMLARIGIDQQYCLTSSSKSSIPSDMDTSMTLRKQAILKRKASDCRDYDLDLNLSLKLGTRGVNGRLGEMDDSYDDHNSAHLSLSLCSPSSSIKVRRLKEESSSTENALLLRASTLDLTL